MTKETAKQTAKQTTRRIYPPNYRQITIAKIMDYIRSGDSCFMVGMSGVSKSNLFRALMTTETQGYYLEDEAKDYVFLWVDTNNLGGELSAFSLYELLLYNLKTWAIKNKLPEKTLRMVHSLHKEAVESNNRTLAQRHLETFIRYLFTAKPNLHLVLLFDEAEQMIKDLDFTFFKNLRWWRDEFKYHLSYVMAGHRSPMAVREELFDKGEAFYELLGANIIGLGPYNPDDSNFMISELAKRYRYNINEAMKDTLFSISGGHAGLLGAIFGILRKQGLPPTPAAQVKQLLAIDSVAAECRKVWNTLEAKEQDLLIHLVKTDFADKDDLPLHSLSAKGVAISGHSKQVTLFSPIFSRFLEGIVNSE